MTQNVTISGIFPSNSASVAAGTSASKKAKKSKS